MQHVDVETKATSREHSDDRNEGVFTRLTVEKHWQSDSDSRRRWVDKEKEPLFTSLSAVEAELSSLQESWVNKKHWRHINTKRPNGRGMRVIPNGILFIEACL